MPLYLVEFGYTPEAWAGLIKSPENREETVRQILEDAGSKLHNLWYTFGENDGFALIEAPDNTTAGALSLAITSSGVQSGPTTDAISRSPPVILVPIATG